jgi:hypothetical protein
MRWWSALAIVVAMLIAAIGVMVLVVAKSPSP